jgi:endonuclease YncB( thermonuclease family)
MNMAATSRVFTLALAICATSTLAADINGKPDGSSAASQTTVLARHFGTITARATIVDGRTLWFPQSALKLRLAAIDVCELTQWSFDPVPHGESKVLKPVPCGSLAKAWLKRTVGGSLVTCKLLAGAADVPVGRCVVKGHDLAREMLRVGWARINDTDLVTPDYLVAQRVAVAARYGMWGTYVLDMEEWRAKAIDRTLGRKPVADFNLLAERHREISPPFQDARRQGGRKDR